MRFIFEYLKLTLLVCTMLVGIPVQNREEGSPPPADSQPPGSQINITTPTLPGDSTISQENIDEVTFFNNNSYKSEYFRIQKKT